MARLSHVEDAAFLGTQLELFADFLHAPRIDQREGGRSSSCKDLPLTDGWAGPKGRESVQDKTEPRTSLGV